MFARSIACMLNSFRKSGPIMAGPNGAVSYIYGYKYTHAKEEFLHIQETSSAVNSAGHGRWFTSGALHLNGVFKEKAYSNLFGTMIISTIHNALRKYQSTSSVVITIPTLLFACIQMAFLKIEITT